jgi:hypothetical protein
MLKRTLARAVDARLGDVNRWRFRQFVHLARRLRHTKPRRHICNICAFDGFFCPTGWPPRPDAQCPQCSSLERHRLFKMWFDEHGQRLAGSKLLHFAPEQSITSFVRPSVEEYVTADLSPGRADLVLNIEEIDQPDTYFDAIICFHILEHVDDRKALSELHRILKPGGALLLMFPIVEGWNATYENPEITSPDDRFLYFGQANHVRFYGADARNRIRAAGFALSEFTADGPEQIIRHGLMRGEKLFMAEMAVEDVARPGESEVSN